MCYKIVVRRMPSMDENGVQQYDDFSNRDMSQEEALLRGMVQNALESSPQENLRNAMEANARFMLPGRPAERPAFLSKVEANGRQILQDHAAQRKRQAEQAESGGKFSIYDKADSD